MTNSRGKGKGDKRQWTPSPTKRQFAPNLSIGQFIPKLSIGQFAHPSRGRLTKASMSRFESRFSRFAGSNLWVSWKIRHVTQRGHSTKSSKPKKGVYGDVQKTKFFKGHLPIEEASTSKLKSIIQVVGQDVHCWQWWFFARGLVILSTVFVSNGVGHVFRTDAPTSPKSPAQREPRTLRVGSAEKQRVVMCLFLQCWCLWAVIGCVRQSRASCDIVEDDSGAYAVFTEQGSFASQMAGAEVQVKMEDAPRLLKILESKCPDVSIRRPRPNWLKSWANIEDLVVFLQRNLFGHPSAGLLWKREFEEVLLDFRWYRVPNCECLFVHRKQGLFLSVYVDDIKMVGQKQHLVPMWMMLMETVGLDELYFWSRILGIYSTWMQTEWNHWGIHKNVWIADFCWSNSKIPGWERFTQKQWRGSTTLKDMVENALSDIASWQSKKWSNFTKFQVFVWMIINSNRRNLNQFENYHQRAHELSWNACIWHELDDQTFDGMSRHLQEQSQNGLRIRRMFGNIDIIHSSHQINSDKMVMWLARFSIVDWVYFKIQNLPATLRIRNKFRCESYVSSEG